MLKKLKSEGKDFTTHKKPIEADDMKQMYESVVFSLDNPVGLQRKVFFELTYQFGRCSCAGWRRLEKDSFSVETDPAGRKYVTIKFFELD